MGADAETNKRSALTWRDLAANGREIYDWRVVDGREMLVVVGIVFTIAAQPGEAYEAFRDRMLRYADALGKLRFPVTRLTLIRREVSKRPPYAQFECATPEAELPPSVALPDRVG